jgi:hypothetical protein
MLMTIDVDDEGGATAAGFYTIATMMIHHCYDDDTILPSSILLYPKLKTYNRALSRNPLSFTRRIA